MEPQIREPRQCKYDTKETKDLVQDHDDQSYRRPLAVRCPRKELGEGQEARTFGEVERSSKDEEEKQTEREKGARLHSADDIYAGYQCPVGVQKSFVGQSDLTIDPNWEQKSSKLTLYASDIFSLRLGQVYKASIFHN